MLKEIQQSKQGLIGHLEIKLAGLRAQRDLITQQITKPNCVQNPTFSSLPKSLKVSEVEKSKLKRQATQLQELYEAKRQFRRAGIEIDDPGRIRRYQNDPKMIKYVQQKKQQATLQAKKQQVIKEQMRKAQEFLASKRASAKQLRSVQHMNYRNILEGKKQVLEKYEGLIRQAGLSRVGKHELICLTFSVLKQWNQLVKKATLKLFLLANPQFCAHFYISHNQINRDLEVYQTKQMEALSQIEFVEFIKSVQLTAGHSAINRNLRKHAATEANCKQIYAEEPQQKQTKFKQRQAQRRQIEYLRRVFNNLNRFNEGIVERVKYLEGLEKGFYIEVSQEKYINIDYLKKLALFINSKTKEKAVRNYFQQLDTKFISFAEIELLWRMFVGEKSKNSTLNYDQLPVNEEVSVVQQSTQEKQEHPFSLLMENEEDLKDSSSSQRFDAEGGYLSQEDFVTHGWISEKNQKPVNSVQANTKAMINNLDKYFQQLEQKYRQPVCWGIQDECRPNFEELEAFIKMQELNKSKQNVELRKHRGDGNAETKHSIRIGTSTQQE